MRHFYSLIFYCALPLVLARLWWRGKLAPAYRLRWRERFGFVPALKDDKPCLWLHAVSVGEVLAAKPLIEALLSDYADHTLWVTTSTPTGSARVIDSFGDRVKHSYAPYDLPDALARFLARLKPRALIIMETELWPNTLAACARRDIPVLLANARLSEKSCRGYQRFARLSAAMMANLHTVIAQHEDDRDRFCRLGLAANKAIVSGNIKFDMTLGSQARESAAELKGQWSAEGRRAIFLAASTHQGEDEIILKAFKNLRQTHPEWLLVLVPRHPERFDTVSAGAQKFFPTVLRRSLKQDFETEQADVVIADTMGELSLMFGAADLVFMGGSLVSSGGHNMIEPAHWSRAIISGPSLFNFAEASRLLLASDAMSVLSGPESLETVLRELFENKTRRLEMGEKAAAVAEHNRGALKNLLQAIDAAIFPDRCA